MSDIAIGGRNVHYIEMGEGPLAVFAHCSMAHAALWIPVMERLADRWRCVAFDMPGHGRTDRGDRKRYLQVQARDYAIGLIEALGGPAHLVGLSLGGATMGRVAAMRPDLARSTTLIEPIYFFLITETRPDMVAENRAIMDPVVKAIEEGRYRDGARDFMEGWGQPGQFDRLPEPAKDAVARALGFVAEDFPMVDGWPEGQITRRELAAIAPLLLIEGETTPRSASAIQDELAAINPRAERAVIAGAGHLSPVDRPGDVAARLAAFFAAAEEQVSA